MHYHSSCVVACTAPPCRYIITHEIYFACLDFVPMIIALVSFNVWHPGMYIASSEGLVEGVRGKGPLEGDGTLAPAGTDKMQVGSRVKGVEGWKGRVIGGEDLIERDVCAAVLGPRVCFRCVGIEAEG